MIILWNSAAMTVTLSVIAGDSTKTYEWEAGRALARDMLAYLRDRLAEHDARFNDIEGIGVFRGPGSFTGLRIGLTVLNTLADANTIPIVGATGDEWQETCLTRIACGENDQIVMPEYGGDAHITKPRK
jgi:tRNA threonylcarbamoyladenosine biosynthesis protein TsaB